MMYPYTQHELNTTHPSTGWTASHLTDGLRSLFPTSLIPEVQKNGFLKSLESDNDCTICIKDHLTLILNGTIIQRFNSTSLSTQSCDIHVNGSWIGLEYLVDREPIESTFYTQKECDLFLISSDLASHFGWYKNPLLLSNLNDILLRKYQQAQFMTLAKKLLPSDQQVIAYLAHQLYFNHDPHGDSLVIHGSQQVVSEAIGVSRTIVSSVLKKLSESGWISYGYKTIEIKKSAEWLSFAKQFNQTRSVAFGI